MLTFDQTLVLKEENIKNLNEKLQESNSGYELLESRYNTLTIQFEKINEQLLDVKATVEDTTEKLHQANKARQEFEIEVGNKQEDIKYFKEQIQYKNG